MNEECTGIHNLIVSILSDSYLMQKLAQNKESQPVETIGENLESLIGQNIEKLQEVMAAFTDSIFQLITSQTSKV